MHDNKDLDSTVYSKNVNTFSFQNWNSHTSLLNNTKADNNQPEIKISIDEMILEEKEIDSSEEEWRGNEIEIEIQSSSNQETESKVIIIYI